MSVVSALCNLSDRVRGDLLMPEHPGYDHARTVFNGMIDRHPVGILMCSSVEDVRAGVTLAVENELPLF